MPSRIALVSTGIQQFDDVEREIEQVVLFDQLVDRLVRSVGKDLVTLAGGPGTV